ncbi:hypothetical protein Pan189_32240 [Stratiformator vulcanicus]|uniref:Uncharacterized protein n=1 Tax=Stratiformator vulcanicus TaxID=2527980 RepID=A0A517R4L9_9PLAN|nr:hypothetical protein Pan189_32240 [Stratiformator vulcanicus]
MTTLIRIAWIMALTSILINLLGPLGLLFYDFSLDTAVGTAEYDYKALAARWSIVIVTGIPVGVISMAISILVVVYAQRKTITPLALTCASGLFYFVIFILNLLG